jgi:rubrerythrin
VQPPEGWIRGDTAPASTTLSQLNAHLRTLIALEATESPFVSCSMSCEGTPGRAARAIERRARAIHESLREEDRGPFEGALDQIRSFLAGGTTGAARGIAAFSRAGSRPFFLGLPFQVPLRNRVTVDSKPVIRHLVELKDTNHRYVVLMATEACTRVLEISLGAIALDLWTPGPDARDRVDPSAGSARRERFLAQTIEIVEERMHFARHTHFVLAGSPSITADLRSRLPDRLASRLIGVVPASADASVWEVVAAARSSFIEREREESLEAVAELARALGRSGRAAAGTAATLEALRRGTANVLVLAKAYRFRRGWGCAGCGFVGGDPASPPECPECGSAETRSVDLK